ncbi:alpha-L-rhamnosidase C-terminal domain-containing protein [Lentzea kentuckyensis]|uniref:alpha-L-rhamnosidase C-terminal domain-containing protein n=1 Tax=Lentzea kentuckyensis TaxID=360086 RepID=UPI003183C818
MGQATVLRLLAEGAHVVAADVNEAGLEDTVNRAGTDRLTTRVLDVSQEEAVNAVVADSIRALGLTWAEAELDSVHGRIATHWRIEDDRFRLTVTVPPGTTATVTLPDGRTFTAAPARMWRVASYRAA